MAIIDSISPASLVRLKALPLDLLIEVFSHLHRSSDLLHVALVSKTFYACSIRLLYRQVQISSPFDFLDREPFWEKHDSSATLNLTTSPRSVIVGASSDQQWRRIIKFDILVSNPQSTEPARFSPEPQRQPPSERQVQPPTNFHPNDHHPAVAFPTFPSRVRRDLFPDVRDRILSFENLKSLAFRGCGLTDDVYHLLSQLKGLRSFTMEGCMMPSVFIRSFESDDDAAWTSENDEERYALVELIIRGNISGTTQYFDLNSIPDAGAPTAQVQSPDSGSGASPPTAKWKIYPAMFHLIPMSPQLQSLCIDWTKDIAVWLSESRLLNESSFPCLEHLDLKVAHHDWAQPHHYPLRTSLALLLSYCAASLKHLAIVGYIPDITVPGGAHGAPIHYGHGLLLPELKKYTGHEVFLISTLQQSCPTLDQVVLDHPYNHVNGITAFRLLDSEFLSRLRCFEIGMEGWDMDIMYAVATKLQGLEELKINYSCQGRPHPSEDELMNFSNLLFRLPNLSVFHLYCVTRGDFDPNTRIYHPNYSYHNPAVPATFPSSPMIEPAVMFEPAVILSRRLRESSSRFANRRRRRRPRPHPASDPKLVHDLAAIWSIVVPKLTEIRLMREYVLRREEGDGNARERRRRGHKHDLPPRQWCRRDLDLDSASAFSFGSSTLNSMHKSSNDLDYYEDDPVDVEETEGGFTAPSHHTIRTRHRRFFDTFVGLEPDDTEDDLQAIVDLPPMVEYEHQYGFMPYLGAHGAPNSVHAGTGAGAAPGPGIDGFGPGGIGAMSAGVDILAIPPTTSTSTQVIVNSASNFAFPNHALAGGYNAGGPSGGVPEEYFFN